MVVLTSCTKDASELTAEKKVNGNIAEVAIAQPQLSSLVAAVVKTNLVGALTNPALNATVFAPSNEAFAKLPAPFNNAANISAITDQAQIDALTNILLYHVVAAEIFKGDVPEGSTALSTLKAAGPSDDNKIYVSNSRNNIVVNGVGRVQRADLDASNGVIHMIDDVLLPAGQNIAEIAIGNPNFSALVAALVKTNLAAVFAGTDDFTVFAPTDDAFAALPAPFNNAANISAITDQSQIDFLANVLKYHVVAGNFFAYDLGQNSMIATLAEGPNNKLIGKQGFDAGRVKGNSNADFIETSAANILANNGVIHVIPTVLLP
jgi:uncharacterized surface protein with fasciclin (FAS1) repeats